jgi:hypothetical protein
MLTYADVRVALFFFLSMPASFPLSPPTPSAAHRMPTVSTPPHPSERDTPPPSPADRGVGGEREELEEREESERGDREGEGERGWREAISGVGVDEDEEGEGGGGSRPGGGGNEEGEGWPAVCWGWRKREEANIARGRGGRGGAQVIHVDIICYVCEREILRGEGGVERGRK